MSFSVTSRNSSTILIKIGNACSFCIPKNNGNVTEWMYAAKLCVYINHPIYLSIYLSKSLFLLSLMGSSLCGVGATLLEWDIIVGEFELHRSPESIFWEILLEKIWASFFQLPIYLYIYLSIYLSKISFFTIQRFTFTFELISLKKIWY